MNTSNVPKFHLLMDVGIVTLGEYYDDRYQLDYYRNNPSFKFRHYDEQITDKNYPSLGTFRAGQRLHIQVFEQNEGITIRLNDCFHFLHSNNFIAEVRGKTIFLEKASTIPKDGTYLSPNKKELVVDIKLGCYLPILGCRKSDVGFGRWYFDPVHTKPICLICLKEL